MDRDRSSPVFRSGSMHSTGIVPSFVLLQSSPTERRRAVFSAPYRRALHGTSVLWISENSSRARSRRLSGQSQEGADNHARAWAGWMPARSQHLSQSAGASEVSVPFKGAADCKTWPGVEHGYHLYPFARRICIPDSSHRLVQSPGIGKPSFKQLGWLVLPRSSGASIREIRPARDFQHGSRGTVHVCRICERGAESWNSIQHGWARTSSRQYFCRATMEVAEVRRGVFT